MNGLVVYAFSAGAVATVNPCGFALLPAWFARSMAAHAGRPAAERLSRAALSGAVVAAGFVTVFVVAGLLFGAGAAWLGETLPWIGLALGVGLAAIGAAWLLDADLPGPAGAAGACRRVDTRRGAYGFGLSYGLVSISCTLPVFTSVAGLTFLADSAVSPAGTGAFLGGAAVMFLLVSVSAATAGAGFSRFVADRAGIIRRIAGGLTLLAGLYIAIYWGRLLFAAPAWADALANRGAGWASAAQNAVASGLPAIVAVGTILSLAVGAAWLVRLLRRPGGHTAKQRQG